MCETECARAKRTQPASRQLEPVRVMHGVGNSVQDIQGLGSDRTSSPAGSWSHARSESPPPGAVAQARQLDDVVIFSPTLLMRSNHAHARGCARLVRSILVRDGNWLGRLSVPGRQGGHSTPQPREPSARLGWLLHLSARQYRKCSNFSYCSASVYILGFNPSDDPHRKAKLSLRHRTSFTDLGLNGRHVINIVSGGLCFLHRM